MTSRALRYQASRAWMEEEILAGRPVRHRRHLLEFDPEELDSDLAARAERIFDGAIYLESVRRHRVLDSGIDPELSLGPDNDQLVPMDAPVVVAIGELPELERPTDDPDAVIGAWEGWLERYVALATSAIEATVLTPPRMVRKHTGNRTNWGALQLSFGPGLEFRVSLADGAEAMQVALSGSAWLRRAEQLFDAESVAAATEATSPERLVAFRWIEAGEAPDRFQVWAKRLYAAAKAHDGALRCEVLDFEVEMERWAAEYGSQRLQLGIDDGYRMNSRYLAERLAKEAPGFYAMPVKLATKGWAAKATSPSEPALRLRRLIAETVARSAPENIGGRPEVEIMIITRPPHQMYWAERGEGYAAELPSRAGWPWQDTFEDGLIGADPVPFEAVVVKNWLGRFHLLGAVAGEERRDVPGIWAVPDPDRYHEDGSVDPEDPDEPTPPKAKRKPPVSPADEIPF